MSLEAIKKVSHIVFIDIKLIMRYDSISISILLFWGLIVFVTYFSPIITPYSSLYITIFLLFVLLENIFNNIIARSENEFIMYNIFPIPLKQLFISKNISNILITLVLLLLMNVTISFIFKLSINKLIDSLLFYFPSLFAILTIGNYFSIRSHRGENKRNETSPGYLFIQQIIFGILLTVYFVVIKILGGGFYYIVYFGIILGFYISYLNYAVELLKKDKFKILEL